VVSTREVVMSDEKKGGKRKKTEKKTDSGSLLAGPGKHSDK